MKVSQSRFARIDENTDRARLLKLTYQKVIGQGSRPNISTLSLQSAGSKNIWANTGGFGLLNVSSVIEINAGQAELVALGRDMIMWLSHLKTVAEQSRLFSAFYSWVYSLGEGEAEATEAAAEAAAAKLLECQNEVRGMLTGLEQAELKGEQLGKELESARESLRESERKLAAGNQGLLEEQEKEADLVRSNQELKVEGDDLQAERDGLRSQIRGLEEELKSCEEAASSAASQQDDLGSRVTAKDTEIKQLQSSLRECQEEVENRKVELGSLQTSLEDLSTKLDAARQEAEDSKRAAEDAERVKDATQAAVGRLEKELDNAQRSLEACEGDDRLTADKLVATENQLQDCQQALQDAADKEERLTRALSTSEGDAADSANQLQECKEELSALRGEARLGQVERTPPRREVQPRSAPAARRPLAEGGASSVQEIVSRSAPERGAPPGFPPDTPHLQKRQDSERLDPVRGLLRLSLGNNNPVGGDVWTPAQLWMTSVDPSRLPQELQGSTPAQAPLQLEAIQRMIEDEMAPFGGSLSPARRLGSSSRASSQLSPPSVQKLFEESTKRPGTDLERWLGQEVVLNDGREVSPNGANMGEPAAQFELWIANATRDVDSVQWETDPARFDLNIRSSLPLGLKDGEADANLLLISTLWSHDDGRGHKRVQLTTDNIQLTTGNISRAVKGCPPCPEPTAAPPLQEEEEPAPEGKLSLRLSDPSSPIQETRSSVEGVSRFDGISLDYQIRGPKEARGRLRSVILDLIRSMEVDISSQIDDKQIPDINRHTESLRYSLHEEELELRVGDRVLIHIRPSLTDVPPKRNRLDRLEAGGGMLITFFPDKDLFFPAGPQYKLEERRQYLWNVSLRLYYSMEADRSRVLQARPLLQEQYKVSAQTLRDIEARAKASSQEALIEGMKLSWDEPGQPTSFDRFAQQQHAESSLTESSRSSHWLGQLLGGVGLGMKAPVSSTARDDDLSVEALMDV